MKHPIEIGQKFGRWTVLEIGVKILILKLSILLIAQKSSVSVEKFNIKNIEIYMWVAHYLAGVYAMKK